MGAIGFIILGIITFFVLYYSWSFLKRSKTGRKRGKAALQSVEIPNLEPIQPGHGIPRHRLCSDWCDPKMKAFPPTEKPLCPPFSRSKLGPGPGTGDEGTIYDLFWGAVKSASPGLPLYGFRKVVSTKAVENSGKVCLNLYCCSPFVENHLLQVVAV